MKKLILTLALILCGYAVSQASILTKQSVELAVGSNPVSILENPSDGMIHIFCSGIDANDNNIYDEGEDEKPSWWTYNPTGSSIEPTMVKEFDNYFVSPFKPSIGTGLINITFKSDKMNNEFVGDTKFEVYSIANFSLLYEGVVSQSEVLTTNYYTGYAITLTRLNGMDLLSYTDITTNETNSVSVNGDIIDFTFVDLDNDGIDEVAILIDNKTLAYYRIGTSIELIDEVDLTKYGIKEDSTASITSDDKTIYITAKSDLFVYLLTLNEKKTGFDVYSKPVEIETVNNVYTLPIAENIHLVSKASKDLVVVNLNTVIDLGQIEMHHSKFDVGYMYSTGQQVYCASRTSNEKKGGQISIYDFTNEPKKDAAQIDMGYTGYQPLDFFPYGESLNFRYYNISLGIDYNFDGVINEDEGDLPPSVWASSIRGFGTLLENAELKLNFNFPINFPLNTNISSDGDIPLPSGNSVHFYNVTDNEVYDTFDAEKYVASVNSIFTYLVMGLRDYETGKSYIRIRKDDQRDFSVEVGTNVSDIIVYGKGNGFNVLSVSEGNFGQPDAKITLVESNIMTGKITTTEFDAGTTGSAVIANSDNSKAAIVMNGSHEIHIFDMNTNEIILTFSTGTSGYGGPRDAKFYNDRLYVTTYTNQVLAFDYETGQRVSTILVDGHTEGLAVDKDYIIVANNNYSDYSANNRILGFKHPVKSSVEETIQSQQTIRVYPHPVSNDFHLVSDDLAGTNDIAIINSQGKIVATHSGSSNGAIALNADALGLVAGNYTAVINGTRVVRFVVIK
ncbi:MAG: hypothetical protein WC121_09300 [Candidatus Kapaibacterium sp.]